MLQGLVQGSRRLVYRFFRAVKTYCLSHPSSPLTTIFFTLLPLPQRLLGSRDLSPSEKSAATMWKAIYFTRHGPGPLFRIETEHPVAVDSDDNKWPMGVKFDNSSNRRFNLKLYDHFQHKPDLRLLDLGCGGGAFVKSVLEDGFTALGLEGSDYSRRLRSAEWDTIPLHLFTADITQPFRVLDMDGSPLHFDAVTAWEVLEHIPEGRVPMLLNNVAQSLRTGGLLVASVAQFPDGNPLTGAVYHLTLKPKTWWLERCLEAGLVEHPFHLFETQDFVRGHGCDLRNWDPQEGYGFHLVMKKLSSAPQ